jgi:hypothetical protein
VSIYVLNDEAGTGTLKRELQGHDGYVSCIRFIDKSKVVRFVSWHVCRVALLLLWCNLFCCLRPAKSVLCCVMVSRLSWADLTSAQCVG